MFQRQKSVQRPSILGALFLLASIPGVGFAAESGVEGLWLSDGYGFFIEIDSTSATLYEITAISCVPRADKLLKASVEPDGSWRFRASDDSGTAIMVPLSASQMWFQRIGTASDILLRRTGTRPVFCDEDPVNTPQANFDVFWTNFKEHYPLFELKGIDWESVGAEVRSQITDATTDDALFDLLVGMISPLEDAHTGMSSESPERQFMGLRSDPAMGSDLSFMALRSKLEQNFDEAFAVIESSYIEGEFLSFCQGHLKFAKLPGELVYLRLDQEGGYTEAPGFSAQLETMEAALDEVFTASRGAKGLILDVRKNYGGSDILSLALASRLTQQDYFAYAKVIRLDPDDAQIRTPPQERRVAVTSCPGFYGPVIQLIGPYTISAGETLTQAMLGRKPEIIRVGENTQGVFSDTLGRQLPNGWRFRLPNELFLTEAGTYFDGPGIPPDIQVPVFRAEDIAAGRDPALEKAQEILLRP